MKVDGDCVADEIGGVFTSTVGIGYEIAVGRGVEVIIEEMVGESLGDRDGVSVIVEAAGIPLINSLRTGLANRAVTNVPTNVMSATMIVGSSFRADCFFSFEFDSRLGIGRLQVGQMYLLKEFHYHLLAEL
jgi:hypothetical protein